MHIFIFNKQFKLYIVPIKKFNKKYIAMVVFFDFKKNIKNLFFKMGWLSFNRIDYNKVMVDISNTVFNIQLKYAAAYKVAWLNYLFKQGGIKDGRRESKISFNDEC